MKELEHFARHNVHLYTNGTMVQKYIPSEQTEHFAELIKSLPASHQVLLVGVHAPSVVAASTMDMERISRQLGYDKQGIPLGLFAVSADTRTPGHYYPVVWGGMYEQRARNGLNSASNATFLHEQGHRVDRLLGSCVASIANRVPMKSEFLSVQSWWNRAVEAQLNTHPHARHIPLFTQGNEHAPPVMAVYKDEEIYAGARSLRYHLSLNYEADEKPVEAFAEMYAHYTMLHRQHKGNAAKIDRILSDAYPVLWPPYRDDVLPLIDKTATELWDRMQQTKHAATQCAADIATLRGDALDTALYSKTLRILELEQGLQGLSHERETKRRHRTYHQEPVKAYEMAVKHCDDERRSIARGATTCMRTEWVGLPLNSRYEDLLYKGIDVTPEIDRLGEERFLVHGFAENIATHFAGTGLAPKNNRKWIIDDFDYIKERFSGRANGLDLIKYMTNTPPDVWSAYVFASMRHETILRCMPGESLARTLSTDEKRELRLECYRTLATQGVSGILADTQGKMALYDAENNFVKHHTPPDTLWDDSTYIEATKTFRTYAHTHGAEAAIRYAGTFSDTPKAEQTTHIAREGTLQPQNERHKRG